MQPTLQQQQTQPASTQLSLNLQTPQLDTASLLALLSSSQQPATHLHSDSNVMSPSHTGIQQPSTHAAAVPQGIIALLLQNGSAQPVPAQHLPAQHLPAQHLPAQHLPAQHHSIPAMCQYTCTAVQVENHEKNNFFIEDFDIITVT